MSTPADSKDLEAIVKKRARELRAHGLPYSDAVASLADELYRTGRGKETRAGDMGATGVLIAPPGGTAANAPSLFSKTKKGKASALGKLDALISPWVSDVYEEE